MNRESADQTVRTRDGIGLNVQARGKGEAVVFLHELLCSARGFDPLVALLQGEWYCITFGARGYPPSDVPVQAGAYSLDTACTDLFDVMDHFDVEAAHVVGVSMGASTALNAALAASRRVRSLTLVSIGTGSTSTPEQQAAAMEGLARTIESKPLAALRAEFMSRPNRRTLDNVPAGKEIFDAQFLDLSPVGIAATIRGILRDRPSLFTMEDDLRSLRVPTLVVCGGEDEPCLEPSRFLARTMPDVELRVLAGTGHGLYLEMPEALASACKNAFQHRTER